MTYITEKSSVSLANKERQLITIEFAPQQDPNETEYCIPQPLFVFGDQVIPKNNLSHPFKICAMELVEYKSVVGQLLNQPYWKYKLTVDNGQEEIWKDESALDRYSPNCSQCPHFNDYQESTGRGWCHLFGVAARKHHLRTNDCDLHSDSDPIDAPHSRFALESIVKIIDPQEHHNGHIKRMRKPHPSCPPEWATFTVIARKHNTQRYRSTESYLNEPEWFYQLAALPYEKTFKPFWVAENDICNVDQSHLISTEDIF